ncbi:MAG: CoA activase [bacterium]|nr:CoA activase [bacterium]
MDCFAGIDIGSTSIKIALIDCDQTLIGHSTNPTGGHFHKNSLAALNALLKGAGRGPEDVKYTVSTGYGRKLFKEADESLSEITANGIGAGCVGTAAEGKIRTIINIGGQDLKVIHLDEEGQVGNFVMNDKCAAGTGRFLEMTARNLEAGVEDLGAMHLRAEGLPLTINSTCTVFAESEIISLLAQGNAPERIAAGVHYSIARRVVRLAKRIGVEEGILFDGGPALNRGLVIALEDELMDSVHVPEIPQITTAVGAAIQAREAYSYHRAGKACG